MGARGFSTGSVLDKDLAYHPATGELRAVCREQRGTTSADIVLAVYHGGVGNDIWTEFTTLSVMTNPAMPKIAVDSQGTVYVGYNEDFGAQRYMALLQYNGSSWSSFGNPAAIQYGLFLCAPVKAYLPGLHVHRGGWTCVFRFLSNH